MRIPVDRAAYLSRLCQVRRELFGETKLQELADGLGIPTQTWLNYEMGIVIPDTTILAFVCMTGVSPHWLLTGRGPTYSARSKPIIQTG